MFSRFNFVIKTMDVSAIVAVQDSNLFVALRQFFKPIQPTAQNAVCVEMDSKLFFAKKTMKGREWTIDVLRLILKPEVWDV